MTNVYSSKLSPLADKTGDRMESTRREAELTGCASGNTHDMERVRERLRAVRLMLGKDKKRDSTPV